MITKKHLKVVDTNILVRFLIGDNQTLANQAQKLFETAEHETLFISDVVLAETVYVLEHVYKLNRSAIVAKLGALIAQPAFYLANSLLLNQSLLAYMKSNTSFVDCYLVAMVKTGVCQKAYTFDQHLHQVDKKRIISPK